MLLMSLNETVDLYQWGGLVGDEAERGGVMIFYYVSLYKNRKSRMNGFTREFTPKTNKPYLTKTYLKYLVSAFGTSVSNFLFKYTVVSGG